MVSSAKAIRFLPSGDPLAATANGLLRSSDNGLTWARVSFDMQDTTLVSMITDRFGAVYIASPNAIYVSRDSAQTWARWTEGLSGSIKHLAIDSSGVLFVSTNGAGVLRSESSVASAPTPSPVLPVAPSRLTVRHGFDALTSMAIEAIEANHQVGVEIYSTAGRQLHRSGQWVAPGPAASIVVPTARLCPGIYLVRIRVSGRDEYRVIQVEG